ncbi:MAG: tol-pal system YbgF family protein [bacterium]
MPMLKPRKRITKKQIKQDKLVTYTFKIVDYIQDHSRQFTFGVVAIIAVLLIGFIVAKGKKQKELNAAILLGKAQLVYESGDYAGAAHLFESVIRQYGGTENGGRATYFLANCYFFTGDVDQALKYYEKYVAKYHRLPSLTASAMAGAAACYEQKGEYAEAARRYEKAATEFRDFYAAPDYLLDAGRCYQAAADTANARKVYRKIVDLYPESKSLQQAKLSLAEL